MSPNLITAWIAIARVTMEGVTEAVNNEDSEASCDEDDLQDTAYGEETRVLPSGVFDESTEDPQESDDRADLTCHFEACVQEIEDACDECKVI